MRLIDGTSFIEWLKNNNYRKMSADEIIYEIETGYFDITYQKEEKLREALEKVVYTYLNDQTSEHDLMSKMFYIANTALIEINKESLSSHTEDGGNADE